MKKIIRIWSSVILLITLFPTYALANSLEGSLQSLVGAVVGRIMPICALPFVAKNIFGYIQGDPDAARQTPKMAAGVVALIGINAVWEFLKSHVR